MAMNERVRRTLEFQYLTDTEDFLKGTGEAENSIAGLERQLKKLKEEFEGAEIGSAEFNRLGNEIQTTSSKLKTLDERFEGLGIEQKNAMIVDSFNVVVGAVGAVTGALVAFGVESEALEGVEKRLLGIITVVSSLREVSNGLAAAQKTLVPLINQGAAALRAFALANPYTAILAGVTAVTAAIYSLIIAQEEEKKSIEDLTKEYDDYVEINQRRATNREKEVELEIERIKLQEGEIAAAERALQLAKDRLEQDEIDLMVYNARLDDTESALGVLEENVRVAERLVQLSEDEAFYGTSIWRNRERYREELKKANVELEKFQQREIDLQQQITKSENDLIKARQDLAAARKRQQEEDARKAKEARDKAEKAAEELANRAVKQLNDQRQATEDLIDLYTELYPEKVTGGQFEFNTELDKTNFALQQQLDVLTSLNTEYKDLGDQLEEINFEESVSFFSQEQLAVFKKLRDANKTELQLQLDALDATYREDLALFSDNEEMKSKITAQYEDDRAKLRRQYAIKTAQDVVGITSNFLNVLADINQQSLELQLLQAAGNQAAIDKINADALEKQKKLRIAQTLVTTAESILNGFNATSTLPPPFNFIAGGILAAAYGALGAKTIQTISATTLEGGGTSGGFNNIPGGFGNISLPGGTGVPVGGPLPGLGGGRTTTPTIGTVAEGPIRAYVLAGDVENGVQANIALNNRRRLAGG